MPALDPRRAAAFTLALLLSPALHATPLEPDTASTTEPTAAPGATAEASDPAEVLPEVTTLGRRENLIGEATSASEGVVGPTELGERPRLRTGDLVEYVPGMVATQHSGSGKANQYFLRGFNLDHGTDFASFVDGMPVNLRTHGHGQGYTDLNFVIPELVEELAYRKGPYHADVGDFGSAGSVSFRLAERLPTRTLEGEVGEFGWRRVIGTGTASAGDAALTWGVEAQGYAGPWTDLDEDVRKRNLTLKGSMPAGTGTAHVLLLAYDNRWNSPDQIPQRAVASGLIDRLGSIDGTLGGDTRRSSLSGGWRGPLAGGAFEATAYTIDYRLDLWSNFTYFLDDPDAGDQFRQFDDRRVHGFAAKQAWQDDRWRLRVGIDGRRDDIDRVGLCRTVARRCTTFVRDDAVVEDSLSAWIDGEWRFTSALRAHAGLRRDDFDFEVDALQPENSGRADDGLTSAKAGLVYTVADPLELYLSWGEGLHSNDARGATITVDPASGEPAERVDPLVRSRGSELGARLFLGERVHATFALWQLDLESELLFVGDAGNTEATRPSARRGAELGVYWFGGERWNAELEVEYTRARFDDADPAGERIPGAIPLVASGGVNWTFDRGWFATARVRHFGRYPLIEDDSERAQGSTVVNLRAGRRFGRWTASLDVLNALDSDDRDIEYFYASRLPGEPADGVEDVHFHPLEPRAVRFALRYDF
jgi:hypothetical protein